MTRRMLLAASTLALALVACVTEPQQDSQATSTGDASASIVECGCPSDDIEWTYDGSTGVTYVTKVDSCTKATLTRSYPDDKNKPVIQSCEDEVAACNATGLVTTDDLAKALGQPEVKLAFAEARTLGQPKRFGLFAPDVWEAPTLKVTVDGATVEIGFPCGGNQGCTDAPAAVQNLQTVLLKIKDAMRTETTCDAKLGDDPWFGNK